MGLIMIKKGIIRFRSILKRFSIVARICYVQDHEMQDLNAMDKHPVA